MVVGAEGREGREMWLASSSSSIEGKAWLKLERSIEVGEAGDEGEEDGPRAEGETRV
jgi:hypothetical protein